MLRPDSGQISEAVQHAVQRCQDPTPFVNHIAFFSNPDQSITQNSIASQWRVLTGANRFVAWLKAKITMKIANFNQPQTCPFRQSFATASEMMPYSLHPCDTGIIKPDGSIHISNLLVFLERCCEMTHTHQIYLRKTKVDEYLARRAELATLEPVFSCVISWHTVAKNEWKEAFALWHDFDVKGDPCMWLSTVLQFYFEPLALFRNKFQQERKSRCIHYHEKNFHHST